MFIFSAAATPNCPEVNAIVTTMITSGVYFISEESIYHPLQYL